MTLEERYNAAGSDTYVGLVKTRQAADAGEGMGVNAFDGAPRDNFDSRVTSPEDQWQTEFKRNPAGSYRYAQPGQNGIVPGTNDNVTDGQGGLSRFTANAVQIAFKDANGRDSIYNRFKNFKTSSPVNWDGYNNFHQYFQAVGKSFVEKLPDADSLGFLGAKTRVSGPSKGPSPAGIGG